MSLTALVAESLFERRDRLVVNLWGASGNAHFFARYLNRTRGASPSSKTWVKNERRPDILQSLTPSQQSTCLIGGRSGCNSKGSCSMGRRGVFLLNQYGCMQSQIMRGSPLRPDFRKLTYFYSFYFACARRARACVRVPSKYPRYT